MGASNGVNVVDELLVLKHDESVRLDPDRLGGLYRQLGDRATEDVICRAIEELALRLTHCERLWRQQDRAGLRKAVRSLIAIADQIGMTTLARVATDVTAAVDAADEPAIGATLFRLMRIGEKSLTAVWDLQEFSV